jgi:hypothetical protein
MTKEFYTISFIFLLLNIFLAIRLHVISMVINYKQILNKVIYLKQNYTIRNK